MKSETDEGPPSDSRGTVEPPLSDVQSHRLGLLHDYLFEHYVVSVKPRNNISKLERRLRCTLNGGGAVLENYRFALKKRAGLLKTFNELYGAPEKDAEWTMELARCIQKRVKSDQAAWNMCCGLYAVVILVTTAMLFDLFDKESNSCSTNLAYAHATVVLDIIFAFMFYILARVIMMQPFCECRRAKSS